MASQIKLNNSNGKQTIISSGDSLQDITLDGSKLLKQIDTIADLRLLTETPSTVYVKAYDNSGNTEGAFGNHFFKLINSAATDNTGTIIVPTGVTTYHYALQYSGAVSVKWFGAIDGADSTLAIQACLDNFTNIYIPSGTYMISDRLDTELDGTIIFGDGKLSELKLVATTDLYTTYSTEASRTAILNINNNNCIVKDLTINENFINSGITFDSGGTPSTGPTLDTDATIGHAASILLGDRRTGVANTIENITIDNVFFKEYYTDCSSVYQPLVGSCIVNNVLIQNCTYESMFVAYNWSIGGVGGEQAINAGSGQSGWKVQNNTIYGALDDAIAVHNNCDDINIYNNTITTTGGRILVGGSTNITIDNNSITYLQDGSACIRLDREGSLVACDHIKITNNYMFIPTGLSVSNGIYYDGAGSNVDFYGNTVVYESATTANGIWIKADLDNDKGGSNLFVLNNRIKNASVGIKVTGDYTVLQRLINVKVEGNHINGADSGVLVNGFDQTVYDPIVYRNTYINTITKNISSESCNISKTIAEIMEFTHPTTYTGLASSAGYYGADSILKSIDKDIRIIALSGIIQDATGTGPDNIIDAQLINDGDTVTYTGLRWQAAEYYKESFPAGDDLILANTKFKFHLDGVGSITTAVGATFKFYYIET